MVNNNRYRDKENFREWVKNYKKSDRYKDYRKRLSVKQRSLYYYRKKWLDYVGKDPFYNVVVKFLEDMPVRDFPKNQGECELFVKRFYVQFPEWRRLEGFDLNSFSSVLVMCVGSGHKRYRTKPCFKPIDDPPMKIEGL